MANIALSTLPLEMELWHKPEEATNGNYTQYDGHNGWAGAETPATFTLDLGKPQEIQQIRVLLYDGLGARTTRNDGRKYNFGINFSDDGEVFREIMKLNSREQGNGWYVIDVSVRMKPRYVQLHAISNTENPWFHIVELEIFDKTPDRLPPSKNIRRLNATAVGNVSRAMVDILERHDAKEPKAEEMTFQNLGELVSRINKALGSFCNVFGETRKALTGNKRLPTRGILFKHDDPKRDWAINEGGGTEIQYHIGLTQGNLEVQYGLGFNTQYVPFANDDTPIGYMRPFMDAFLRKEEEVRRLLPDYSFVIGERNRLVKPKNDEYTLFGKRFDVRSTPNGFVLKLTVFNEILQDLQNQLKAYKLIFQERNNPGSPGTDKENIETKTTIPIESVGSTNILFVDSHIPPALGVIGLASDIASLLSNHITTEKGNMVGVFGEWGRGKSYLIREILKQESIQEKFIPVEYHAWKYQDTPASWAYLYQEIAQKYFEKEHKHKFVKRIHELCLTVRLNISKSGWYPMVIFFLSIVIFFGTLYAWPTLNEVLYWLTLGASATVIGVGLSTYIRFKKNAVDLFSKYLKRTEYDILMGSQAEIQKELADLLAHWIPIKNSDKSTEVPEHQRILLVIEDIDRCSEDRIIELVDSLRVMLDDEVISKRIIVLAAVDERILKRAISTKYYDSLKKDHELRNSFAEEKKSTDEGKKFTNSSDNLTVISQNIVHEYMDKLFIASIKLGALADDERLDYFNKLIANHTIKPTDRSVSDENPVQGEAEQNSMRANGPTKNPFDSQSSSNENPTDDVSFDYTAEEVKFLQECIAGFKDATPRKIRIFTYRYILGRTLLRREGINSYSELSDFANALLQETTKNPTQEFTPSGEGKAIEDLVSGEVRRCIEMVKTY
jgi:hypothetical protein